jgi:protease-4
MPGTPVTAQVVGPGAGHYGAPQYGMPPPRRRGGWGRLFVIFLLLALVGSVAMNFVLGFSGVLTGDASIHVQEKHFSHSYYAPDKVVILPITGVILESEDGFVKKAIDKAMEDKTVKAMVLRVDSPGGSVSGSDFIYHHLRKMAENNEHKVPIVVSMGSIAASGGYYVSMAVGHEPDVIFAEPTAFTGSIGVIIPHYNVSAWMEEHHLVDDSIVTNPLKELGSMTKPMSKEERQILQALVDDSFGGFKKIVRSGREKFEKDPAALDKLATGQVYTANQAKENGLIDKLGFLEDAVTRAIELAKLDKDKVTVVRYAPEASLLSALSGAESRSSVSAEAGLQAIMNATTPKA